MITIEKLSAGLDRELRVSDFHDDSHNGLQVGGTGTVRRVACGVDASLAFFEEAAAQGANFLVCHHGLSWGDSLKRVTGLNHRHIAFLVRNNLALYACHLPLDAHPTLGNNAQIAKALGLLKVKPFGVYRGNRIGTIGELPRAETPGAFLKRVRRSIGENVRSIAFGPRRVRRIAIVSGGAADMVADAAAAGADVFLSGEPTLRAYNLAHELGIHAVFAGHYDTEVFGVRAVGAMLKRRYRLDTVFIRHDVPF